MTVDSAAAADLEDLAKEGYGALVETRVEGEFNGCDYDKRIPLQNGLVFVCRTYGYSYAYMPSVFIMKSVRTGEIKVVIDDREYAGELFRKR